MKALSEMPEFLAVGHVTHDHVENGELRLGGAALYSALTADRLGKKTALLTSFGEDFEGRQTIDRVAARVIPTPRTSSFRNVYETGGRVQYVHEVAASLHTQDLPVKWTEARLVYLCPVLHEFRMDMGEAFKGSMLGVAPQGWMRTWDEAGRIRGREWKGFERLLDCSQMVIVSEEDIVGAETLVDVFRAHAPIVILTRAGRGAVIFADNRTLMLGAHAAVERDPTGAGDCFGAAFLIRYKETGSIEGAARFASCVGAFVVEEEGIAGIPSRGAVERRMREESISCEWKDGVD